MLELKLESILERKINDLLAPVSARIQALENDTNNLNASSVRLESNPAAQLLSVEKQQISARANNIIITDIKENADTANGVKEILQTVTESALASETISSFGRLGHTKSRPRPIRVLLASQHIRNKACKKAKLLRRHANFNKIYVNPDLPPATTNENARLRKHAKELRWSHPNATIYIRKGRLFLHDNTVDSFNLSNQTDSNSSKQLESHQ